MRVFQVTGFFIRFPWTPGFFISDLFVNFAYVNRHLPYMKQRYYIAIDLKSFYASVECVERGLNPLDACLVVADKTRTDKTICLAVSPALKAYGVPGRPRLFEVMQRVGEVNRNRGRKGISVSGAQLAAHPDLAVGYIVAKPRMQLYMDYSARIFSIYMRTVAAEDIHVYSVDEVFIDATDYIEYYRITPHDLAMRMIREVLDETGITATAGIGTNLYLCKIAMDIVAKKMPQDKDGVRIAELDEMSYRRTLWSHTPLTDFWRIGRGLAKRLESVGLRTMGDIARYSLENEDWLYGRVGVNAELLIDHAWGWEPVTMAQVKAYRPDNHSISNGQILASPYTFAMALNVIREMADNLALELVEKTLVTDQIVLTVGYDTESLKDPAIRSRYRGRVTKDFYGRMVPYHAHGTLNFDFFTSSCATLRESVAELFKRIVNPYLLIRRMNLTANRVEVENRAKSRIKAVQLDLFSDHEEMERKHRRHKEEANKERKRQEAIINLRKQYGKNVILTGLNYTEGATQRERNRQIGGHNA